MKKLLLTTAMLLVAWPALADTIALSVFEDGALVGSATSADGNLNIDSLSYGTFNLNTLSINSATFLAPPGILSTNTLDVQQFAQPLAHTLQIDITANGLVGPAALRSLLSEFSVTGLTTGWSAQELTFINGAPLSNTPVFTANSASADASAIALLTNPFSASVEYLITTQANTAGSFNGGIDINLNPVPIPEIGSGGLGMALTAMMGLLWLAKRRRGDISAMPA